MNKDTAINMLMGLFNDNTLSFRDMATLKSVFDDAVAACDEMRSEDEASYHMGRSAQPTLSSKDTEEDFYYTMTNKVIVAMSDRGIITSDKALEAIVDFTVTEAEYKTEDFFYTP